MKRVHAYVSGRVQGVNFRWNTKIVADKLGIKGWVKNLKDGRVEIIAEGEDENIKTFLKYIRKGPILAKVDKVEIKEEVFKNEFKEFSII
ncbi:MAG: acylphosphatase [Candidatus Aenigmarchaeota archaeon]|nr:acylphosphatase [Candidatus Aenigmarchaeota archaeon]MBU5689064.1 acylphosphatase [Candidatus Aenigmarchaeota archaeon]